MKILHLAPSDPSASGVAMYASRFRRALEEEGAAVAPPCWSGAQPSDILGIRRYVASARRAAEDVDVVHAELSGESLADFYAAREVLRVGAAPVCLTLHDPPRAVWAPFAFSPLTRSRVLTAAVRSLSMPVSRRLEHSTISDAAEIFVLSARGAAAVGGGAIVLPFPLEGSLPPASVEPKHDGLAVGFFGHWYGGKRVELLVRAAAIVHDEGCQIALKLWGTPLQSSPGAGRYRNSVLALARELGLGEVLEAGALPEDCVATALRELDVVVLPYDRPRRLRHLASASSALIEVLAAGTPVVTSEAGHSSEVIRPGENGLLFPAGDVDGLANCLRQLHADPELRKRLREGAIRSARILRLARPGKLAVSRYRELLSG